MYLSLPQTSKNAMFLLLSFMIFVLQNWRTEDRMQGERREVVGKGVGG
jgi:hypothetical protein